MSTTASDELVGALEELALRVPGVTTLYRSGSAVAAVASAMVSALRSSASASSAKSDRLVLVGEGDGGMTVTVTIGVAGDSAAEVCRAVHDAIADRLRTVGLVPASIEVTVGQVAD